MSSNWQFYHFANNAQTTLTAAISSTGATTMQVASAAGFPTEPFLVVIDSEIIRVTSTAGGSTAWTIQRGQEGTTAATHGNSSTVSQLITKDSFLSTFELQSANLRLSMDPVDPHPMSGSGSTMYALPYRGNKIALLDPNDTHWRLVAMASGIPLSIAPSAGALYDVFAYLQASTGVLLEATAWSASTVARTSQSGLVQVDGVWVRADDNTRRYLGTYYTLRAGYCEDTPRHRHLWNVQNREKRKLLKLHNFSTYTNVGYGLRPVNNDTDERVDFVIGLSGEAPVSARGGVALYQSANSSGGSYYSLSLSLDSASALSGQGDAMGYPFFSINPVIAFHESCPGAGFHFLQMMDEGDTFNSSTITVYGSGGSGGGGILGHIEG